MLHLSISLSSYILFTVARMLMPTQHASWRLQEIARHPQSR
jgi:hypothetical protein